MAKLGTAYILPDRSVLYREDTPLDADRTQQVQGAFRQFEQGRGFGPMHLVIGPEIEVVIVDEGSHDMPNGSHDLLQRLVDLGVDPDDLQLIAERLS